jgi:hypothetical protein
MADKQSRETAVATFRQFAWNLAGTLADNSRAPAKPQSRAGSKR